MQGQFGLWIARRALATAVAVGLVAHGVGATDAAAVVPGQALIEGSLATAGGSPAADGSYGVKIGLYKDAQGGAALWAESASIEVKSGQFQHALGSAAPLSQPVLAAAAYIGIAVGSDPELPRKPLHSVLYAARAGVAENIACSACIQAAHLDTQLANDIKNTIKASDLSDVAKSGNYADLQGVPNLQAYAKTTDLKKVALTGSYADLADKPALPKAGDVCGTNLVVKGLKADGSLDCTAGGGGNLPPDGIDDVSNQLIFNTFVDKKAGTADVQIPDFAGPGVSDVVDFPDIGVTQKVWIEMDLSNSDMSAIKIELYGPSMSTPYLLYNGGKTGNTLKAKFNDDTPLVSGDMDKDWVGKNIKGLWSITVRDLKDNTPQNIDGKFNWSVNIQTLSNKKIQIKGDLIVDGNITAGGTNPTTAASVYWAGSFQTYSNGNGDWYASNNAAVFGGLNGSTWTDGNGHAANIGNDFNSLRTIFNQRRALAPNTVVCSEIWPYTSSTTGRVCGAVFRVKNTTANAVNWQLSFYYTSYSGWSETASLSINGATTWTSNNNAWPNTGAQVNVSVPANKTSTVVVVAPSSPGYGNNQRDNYLAFYNNSLTLPTGLQYVDDYEVVQGPWK